ncbi:MAG: hypothetical protein JW708_07000 [Vallitaleaceae bacterium]|nr:hypothetical protein [Vallitaleaceae bacterium]
MKTLFNDILQSLFQHFHLDINQLADLIDRHPSRIRHWKLDSRPSKQILIPLIAGIIRLIEETDNPEAQVTFMEDTRLTLEHQPSLPQPFMDSLLHETNFNNYLSKLIHFAYEIKPMDESAQSVQSIQLIHPYLLRSIISGHSDSSLSSGKLYDQLQSIHPLLASLTPHFPNEVKSITLFEEVIRSLEEDPKKNHNLLQYFRIYLLLLYTRLLEFGDLPYHYTHGMQLFALLESRLSTTPSITNDQASILEFCHYQLQYRYAKFCYHPFPEEKTFGSAFCFTGNPLLEKRSTYEHDFQNYLIHNEKKELLLAISAVKDALMYCDVKKDPYLHMDLHHKLGEALYYYHRNTGNSSIFEQAEFSLSFSLELFSKEKFPERHHVISSLLSNLRKEHL